MNETRTARALLDLEDAGSEILFAKVPGSEAYLWPLARWPIARALAEANLGVVPHRNPVKRATRAQNVKRMARESLPNPMSSDRLRTEVKHLFIVSGTTRTSAPRGVGNWLSDSFAAALGDRAAVVQDASIDLLTSHAERPANPRTWTFAPALVRVKTATRTNPLSEDRQRQALDSLHQMITPLNDLLPESIRELITKQVLGRVRRLSHADAEFGALLDRVRPIRIYMQTAAYGDRSSFIRIAHERGIEVAELQHGWIGSSHAAYNFGKALRNSELTSSLPDALLTFGDYWGERLRFPGRIVPIGKPSLEQSAASAPAYTSRPSRLLLVSSVYERERLIAAALLLRRSLPDSWQIVIRPHPSERTTAQEIFAPALSSRVVLDKELDVNASISQSRAVVGMISTVLFEALPFGVHIGVIETGLAEHYAEATVFPRRLEDEQSFFEFSSVIQTQNGPEKGVTDAIWQPGAASSFLVEAKTRH